MIAALPPEPRYCVMCGTDCGESCGTGARYAYDPYYDGEGKWAAYRRPRPRYEPPTVIIRAIPEQSSDVPEPLPPRPPRPQKKNVAPVRFVGGGAMRRRPGYALIFVGFRL